MSEFEDKNKRTLEEQVLEFFKKGASWVKKHPKDTIIIGLVVVILVII